jgi:hypothetical protein
MLFTLIIILYSQISTIVLLVFMALLFYCLSMARMLYPNSKVNANQITQDPTAQVAADMTLHRVNTVLRRSDNATVTSECSVEDVEVTVSRIPVPIDINVRPAPMASLLRMLHFRKLNFTSSQESS